jgi:cell division protein FtsB
MRPSPFNHSSNQTVIEISATTVLTVCGVPQRFSFRIISSSFFRSASKIFSFAPVSSGRLRLWSLSNLRRVLAAGSRRSSPGAKLFAISFQYSQTTKASAQMISGVSTKRRMGLAQLLLLLFLLATFDRSPNNLLRLCRLLKKTQRRDGRKIGERRRTLQYVEARRLRPTKHMSLFQQPASNSAYARSSGWR